MPQFCILFYANYTILATQRGDMEDHKSDQQFLSNLNQITSFIEYSLYYAEACSELVGVISASLRLRATKLLRKKCRSCGEPLATLCSI